MRPNVATRLRMNEFNGHFLLKMHYLIPFHYWLLLCWACYVAADNPAIKHWPDTTQISGLQMSTHSPRLCQDSRCSCSHPSFHGANVTCQCSPQDQVNVSVQCDSFCPICSNSSQVKKELAFYFVVSLVLGFRVSKSR